MFLNLWHTIFFDPVYNILVFFIDVVPGGDIGLAIVFTTIVVKTVLLPLSMKAAHTQRAMRLIEPELKRIQEKYKDKREELAKHMMELYKKAGVNPFSSILLLFIQIPIIIALYFSVARGGGVHLPEINTAILYSFIPNPETASMLFLGAVDMAAKSFPIALIAGLSQYVLMKMSLPPLKPREKDATPNFKDDFSRSMQIQMKYGMPIIIFVIGYTISAAIALYFAVSNIFGIAQEYVVRKRHPHVLPEELEKQI
ncbi:YidC/Oxa1 family membrane protein insertase [Candidatus Parcubacteria bacterium]|uniref:Membrane insertase YidC/Oxa/ALB C-terminal domain-containing protein n=1 Tax=Candidatus Kaiserbacteria bacterium CG10_big_fil_rev_8_21_14_0_10_47_16 TaxID=1974608 RepID=A0A2H0UFP3_9BACT|nr:YidC/Oxa1 family membrane protein insertase [Candidatus Parcubacteria bacterium]PIR84615.1 MAG: hypothetical protein COU16_03515 [Candidatus Kaiserbacteria bacterium CG10_big_fil_rev_8_21_14_0_10_47_16]